MTEAANMNAGAVTLDENGFIPGTSYKSVDELVKGHMSLKEMADRQGTELGNVRKENEGIKTQAETLATVLKETLTNKGKAAQGETKPVDYQAELTAVETEIQNLDPVADDYQKNLAKLVAKSNKLVADATAADVMNKAGKLFKDELSNRDVKAAEEAFHRDNPTFRTPEMQARIKDKIANDKTGMLDPLAAFREIERDDATAKATALEKENVEYKRLIDLNKGKDETGKVVVKGQSTGQQESKQQKATGKDLDAGMLAALKASRE